MNMLTVEQVLASQKANVETLLGLTSESLSKAWRKLSN
jgi:hypothetical protein